LLLPLAAALGAQPDARTTLRTRCQPCHQGTQAAAGLNLSELPALPDEASTWQRIAERVQRSEMPPKGAPALTLEEREQLTSWIQESLRSSVCGAGPVAGPAIGRRLNRTEYSATLRDLLNIHIDAGHLLPADGAGGEGFDNAAETLFLSPIHAEKYLQAAQEALEYAARDPQSRAKIFVARPGGDITEDVAAERILRAFLPRAFRRPVEDRDVARYQGLFLAAKKRGAGFEEAILFCLRGALISPQFLFRSVPRNNEAAPRRVDDYELASRLSYFLWNSMPDEKLFALAANRTLHEPAVLRAQMQRMLKDAKSREFAESFVEQWLNTRELGRDIKPDPQLFASYYDAETQSAIRYEPVLFFQELLADDLSLLNLIDSNWTILTNKLQRHYELKLTEKLGQQPVRVTLPDGSHRGGVLGMSAVLAVSSYPQRTSPVLRGKWVLEALLGTPPPPPPPNVPALADEHAAGSPKTMRERLTQHRANPACATCHDRIDPLGFSLENYDMTGRWRTTEAGQAIDASGQLTDGTKFTGPEGLRSVLLARKDLFLRNLTAKMLGYALGRSLVATDRCTVDQIAASLEANGYRAQELLWGVVSSVPFQYQAGVAREEAVKK